MVDDVDDLVLFPHCDLHVSLAHAPQLRLQVFHRSDGPTPADPYSLIPITSLCEFDFFAPDLAVGDRFDHVPTVDKTTGVVTATTSGRYLFQVRFSTGAGTGLRTRSIVGSLQVHADVLAWWFGIGSITTALDPTLGHAQPTIYAKFSDDPTGTERIGDITGHDYVQLTSSNTSRIEVMPRGRLRGVMADGQITSVTGTFVGPPQSLPVRVVDYARPNRGLRPVQVPDLAGFAKMHNLVFIAEGFRPITEDQKRFDELVTKTVDQMFEKPRHQPYPMLEGRLNSFKVLSTSQEHAVTIGYRVCDQDVGSLTLKGLPIPVTDAVSSNPTVFTPAQLVAKVGLPRRGEQRGVDALFDDWKGRGLLADDERPKLDHELIEVWKAQRSLGILQARDTFFGMILGIRPADGSSSMAGRPAAPLPGADGNPVDAPSPDLNRFVARLYEQFTFRRRVALEADRRRHPPELYAGVFAANPLCSIVRFLEAQSYVFDPFPHIGPVWVPHPTQFKPSRGLVALLANEVLVGGQNINKRTITAQAINKLEAVKFHYETTGEVSSMLRDLPEVEVDLQDLVDTVVHELSHSFNLHDEYETAPGDGSSTADPPDFEDDNVTDLATIHLTGGGPREIDPAKVKWLGLPRMAASEQTRATSVTHADGYDLLLNRQTVDVWKKAMTKGTEVVLRTIELGPTGQQLPLPTGPTHVLPNLRVLQVEEFTGLLRVGGPGFPAANPPTFAEGSLLYIPKIAGGVSQTVAQRRVIEFITQEHKPLNVDPDHEHPKDEADNPVSITDLSPPCIESRLIGVYEGAVHSAGAAYRPAGQCKMRTASDGSAGDGELCHVCKWLIVNNVDPGMHALLDYHFYPGSKKNG